MLSESHVPVGNTQGGIGTVVVDRFAGGPSLIGLFKAMETHAARDRLEGRPAYDTGWLWAELGLARPPHDG